MGFENVAKAIKFLELGKQIGILFCGDEEAVVKELEHIEERDIKVMKRYEEGNKKGFL